MPARYHKDIYEDVARILAEHSGYVTARVVTDDIARAFADLFAADNPPTCLEHTDASADPIDAQHHDPSDHVDARGETSPKDCQCIDGCVRVMVQPDGFSDGKPYDPFGIDEPQLEVVSVEAAPKARPKHGPRADPARLPNPKR